MGKRWAGGGGAGGGRRPTLDLGSASAVGTEVATATTAAESTTAAPPPAIAESALPAPAEVSNPLSGLMAGYADSDEEEEPATGGEVQADSKVAVSKRR